MQIKKCRNKTVIYPILLYYLEEHTPGQVSQLEVASKDCALGSALDRGEEESEAGPGMDTHLEVISSSLSWLRPTAPLRTDLKTLKTPD